MIRVFFADGTHEDRDPRSFVHAVEGSEAHRLPRFISERDAWAVRSMCYFTLDEHRGRRDAVVWRITGQDIETKALTGRWVSCRVESVDEQIARLTRERDAALAVASLNDALAEWNTLNARDEKARADAAEKRLADLRAWAVKTMAFWRASLAQPGGATPEVLDRWDTRARMLDRVILRIDGMGSDDGEEAP